MGNMMGRAAIGAVAAAVAMFILGFIFYATPLQKIAVASATDAQAAAVQQAMAANLPRTGTYFVPDAATAAQSTMYSQGPVATVHYNSGGFAVAAPDVMINDDAMACLDKVHSILEAERLKASRRTGLHDFVRGLIG